VDRFEIQLHEMLRGNLGLLQTERAERRVDLTAKCSVSRELGFAVPQKMQRSHCSTIAFALEDACVNFALRSSAESREFFGDGFRVHAEVELVVDFGVDDGVGDFAFAT